MNNDVVFEALKSALLNQTTTARNALSRIRNNIKSGKPDVINAQAIFFANLAFEAALSAEALYKNAEQPKEEQQMRDIRIALANFASFQNQKRESQRQFDGMLSGLLRRPKRSKAKPQ